MKASKQEFIKNSHKAEQVKKEFLLSNVDLEEIRVIELFSLVRFLDKDILKYLNDKLKKN